MNIKSVLNEAKVPTTFSNEIHFSHSEIISPLLSSNFQHLLISDFIEKKDQLDKNNLIFLLDIYEPTYIYAHIPCFHLVIKESLLPLWANPSICALNLISTYLYKDLTPVVLLFLSCIISFSLSTRSLYSIDRELCLLFALSLASYY